MNNTDENVAVFIKNANRIFNEHMEAYKDKKSMYLAGTTLLRNRVLHHLIETMKGELITEKDNTLRTVRRSAPQLYHSLEDQLTKLIYGYVSSFREADADAS
jgi:hypothetical protein